MTKGPLNYFLECGEKASSVVRMDLDSVDAVTDR